MMYVCLTTLRKSVTGWDTIVQKMQAFLFLQLIVLMHFVPVEFFILEIKGYNKKILEKMLFWPLWWCGLTLSWSDDFSIAGLQNVGFCIYDFLDDLWLEFFHVFFLTCVFCSLFFFLSFFFFIIYFLKKQRVSECQIFLFFFFFLRYNSSEFVYTRAL